MRRHLLALAIAVLLSPVLTGCSAGGDGVIGIGVDESGRPMGFLRSCEERMEAASLIWPDDPRQESPTPTYEEFARWEITVDTRKTTVSWSLLRGAGPGLVVVQMANQLPAGKELSLGAGGGTYTAGDVEFTATTFGRLRPGQILVGPAWMGEDQTVGIVDLPEFERLACARSVR